MYNSFRPPTDNLYKFLALFGLFLLGFAIWIAWKSFWESASEFRDVANLQREHNELIAVQWGAALREAFEKADGDMDAVGEFLEDAVERASDETAESAQRLERREWDAQLATESTALILIFATVLGAVGILLSFIGFLLWYFKVQRYQDRILRQQAAGDAGRNTRPKKRLRAAPAPTRFWLSLMPGQKRRQRS